MKRRLNLFQVGAMLAFTFCAAQSIGQISPPIKEPGVQGIRVNAGITTPSSSTSSLTCKGDHADLNIIIDGSIDLSASGIDASTFSMSYSYIADIWGTQLIDAGSTVNVHLVPDYTSFSTTSGGVLMSTDVAVVKDGGASTLPNDDLYPQALANYLFDLQNLASGNHYAGSTYDMTVSINVNAPWALSGCVGPNYDLASVLAHEIGHGLGFTSALDQPSGTSGTLNMDWLSPNNTATIYEAFIWNSSNYGSPYLNTASGTDRYNWGTGDNLYFNGSHIHSNYYVAGAPFSGSQRIYAPNPWESGSSVAHLYQASSSTPATELMQPYQGYCGGLRPSTADDQIMGAIGWCPQYTTGCEINICTPDMYGYCSGGSTTLLSPGGTYPYTLDAGLCGSTPSGAWSLVLYSTTGPITVTTGPTSPNWGYYGSGGGGCTVPSATDPVMTGHTWMRDVNGNIKGKIVCAGIGSLGIKVVFPIQGLKVSSINSSSYWCLCDHETLNFASVGATSYKVSYRHDFFGSPGISGTWSSWSSPVTLTADQLSYTFGATSPLSQYDNYQFQVTALGSGGSTLTSSIISRNRCMNWVMIAPNPVNIGQLLHIGVNIAGSVNPKTGEPVDATDDNLKNEGITDLTLGMDNNTAYTIIPEAHDPCGPKPHFVIGSVTLTNLEYTNIVYKFKFDGSGDGTVNIDTHSITPGNYAVNVIDIDGVASGSTVISIGVGRQ